MVQSLAVAHTQDDGFHEIQLNGKQLVFLFMAATVVSVVIFLSGVLVGRGVRAERSTVAQAAALNETPAPDAVPPASQTTAAVIQAGADPRTATPPPPADDPGYTERLEKPSQPAEELKPTAPVQPNAAAVTKPTKDAATKPATPSTPAATPSKPASPAPTPPKSASPAPTPAASPAATPTATVPATPAGAEPTAAGGFAVQVAAVNVRGDADTIAKRLASKGYAAYVETPTNNTGVVFRVRVGKFKTRREAEVIAAKLQKEEQIKPWVTR